MQKRKPIPLDDGTLAIPLGPQGRNGVCYIDAKDYEFLVRVLGVSENWNTAAGGYVVAPCRAAIGNRISIARTLLSCSGIHTVRYLDGSKTNLRRSNLAVREGGMALHSPRSFLRPQRLTPATEIPYFRD
jgi:hypothetical protein